MTIYSHLTYLEKQRFLPRQIQVPPSADLRRVIVIPAFDEPDITGVLDSLEACHTAPGSAEVILVLNQGADRSEAGRLGVEASLREWERWHKHSVKHLNHYAIALDPMPRKQAGVGLARKIGMDEAVDRLLQADHPKGLIVCLDADCRVSPTYLQDLEKADLRYPRAEAFSLDFAHPLEGEAFGPEIYDAIIAYELYLRYYIEALRWAGHPHAYHCIGSSMAVRANAYQARGGMNRRKAGEDFYFLQKFIQENTLIEIASPTVYPAPRPSHRVPFGTGKAVNELITQGDQEAFSWESIEWLRGFIAQIPGFYQHPPEASEDPLFRYLDEKGLRKRIEEISGQVRSEAAFIKRFFKWFNGLRVLQFLHEARDQVWAAKPVLDASEALFSAREWPLPAQKTALAYLLALRQIQKGNAGAV